MLLFMGLKDDAIEFWRIASISDTQELVLAMSVDNIQKRIVDQRYGIDPIEKCMWILQTKFACHHFGYSLNTDRFATASMVFENLRLIQLPIILSVIGKESHYNHVVVMWRNEIIDFENKVKYPLNVANAKNICHSSIKEDVTHHERV